MLCITLDVLFEEGNSDTEVCGSASREIKMLNQWFIGVGGGGLCLICVN